MQWDLVIPEMTLAESELLRFVEPLATQLLSVAAPFVVWLDAPMGAGKTALTRQFLYRLGLPAREPVTSPTFTLVNEYHIADHWYAHLDLYRAGGHLDLESLDLPHQRDYRGLLVEWMDVGDGLGLFAPTHKLTIQHAGDQARRYALWRRRG